MTREAPPPHITHQAAGTLVVEEPRFAIVAEWVIDAVISAGAFWLYSLLLRYGNGSGCRMPSRQTLARRLRRSVDAVDRAMHQLRSGRRNPHNRSHRQIAVELERLAVGPARDMLHNILGDGRWEHTLGTQGGTACHSVCRPDPGRGPMPAAPKVPDRC